MRMTIVEVGKPLTAGLAAGAAFIAAYSIAMSAGGQFTWYAARAAGMVRICWPLAR